MGRTGTVPPGQCEQDEERICRTLSRLHAKERQRKENLDLAHRITGDDGSSGQARSIPRYDA